jgi:hypothetical protein
MGDEGSFWDKMAGAKPRLIRTQYRSEEITVHYLHCSTTRIRGKMLD